VNILDGCGGGTERPRQILERPVQRALDADPSRRVAWHREERREPRVDLQIRALVAGHHLHQRLAEVRRGERLAGIDHGLGAGAHERLDGPAHGAHQADDGAAPEAEPRQLVDADHAVGGPLAGLREPHPIGARHAEIGDHVRERPPLEPGDLARSAGKSRKPRDTR
jgi:hypothetical protein